MVKEVTREPVGSDRAQEGREVASDRRYGPPSAQNRGRGRPVFEIPWSRILINSPRASFGGTYVHVRLMQEYPKLLLETRYPNRKQMSPTRPCIEVQHTCRSDRIRFLRVLVMGGWCCAKLLRIRRLPTDIQVLMHLAHGIIQPIRAGSRLPACSKASDPVLRDAS